MALAQSAPTPLRPTAPIPAAPQRQAPSGFSVESLKAPDGQGVGVLDPKQGGFGIEMWDGTPRAMVTRLLPRLPAATPSPALRDLMRRLLLSTAIPPAGAGESLLLPRIERLWAMGEIAGMLKLLDALPAAALDETLQRYRVDGLLLRGEDAAACGLLPALREGKDTDGAAAQLSAFCDALAGRTAQAALTAAWLRERGLGDGAFFTLLEAMTGSPGSPDSLPQPRPLHLAMARAAKAALPADAASAEQTAILAALAGHVQAPLEARVVAAEKAHDLGAIDPEVLRRLYSEVTFGGEAASQSVDDAAEPAGWRSRALLFRIAQTQTAPGARAEILAKALAAAARRGRFVAAARLYGPLLDSLAPDPKLSGFAGTAVRALLAIGRRDLAGRWAPLCPPMAAPVWPLLRLVEPHDDDPPAPGQLAGWLKQRSPLPAAAGRRQAALLFGLLDALGQKVRIDDWLELMTGPPQEATIMPQPALWHGQRLAAEDLRLGETVLLALVSLGDGFPETVDPTAVYRVVAALRLVGFDDEARAVALEAALAHGV